MCVYVCVHAFVGVRVYVFVCVCGCVCACVKYIFVLFSFSHSNPLSLPPLPSHSPLFSQELQQVEQAAMLLERASTYYHESGNGDTAGQVLTKAAKYGHNGGGEREGNGRL